MNIIKVENLSKSYGSFQAVNNISFEVESGSLFAFLGKNGAGKSTTINIISTLLEKSKGKITIDGFEVGKDDDKIRNTIGVVFQESLLDTELTVLENLVIRGSMYNLSKEVLNNKIKELTEIFSLDSILNQKYGSLSGGQKRIVDISKGLIHSPKVLILDEPTTGLDPKIRVTLWETLKKLRETQNLTIFLTTHYMEETKFADKVVIINKGEVVASGTPAELKTKFSKAYLKLVFKNINDAQLIKDFNYTQNVDEFIISFKDSFEALDLINQLRDKVLNFEIYNGDMDDVFLNANEEVL